MRPSFLGLIFSGLLILVAIILGILNMKKISIEHGVMIVLLLAIAVSAHSIQHAVEEIYFQFNPLIGQWLPKDTVACPCGPQCPCGKKNNV
jgi:disulfide bond formation protein DsbB